MSRLISEILNAPEPHFAHTLQNWEQLSGHNGHDVRLTSEIVQLRKKALRELNLDENDTTSRELFHALSHRAAITNTALEAELKISVTDTPEAVVQTIVGFIDGLTIKRDIWTIKHSVIKQLLKKHPPKKLMKVLGLRSIDSVLKRMSAYELLALAYQIETDEWVAKMKGQYKKLKPADFQAFTSSICVVDQDRVEKLHKGGYKSSRIIVPNYETGTILVVPPPKRFELDVLALTLALLQTLYELRIHSAYFRVLSVKHNFGSKLQQVLQEGLPGSIKNMEIGWTVLQRHFTQFPESFDALEQPHLQPEDIVLVSPTEALMKVVPELTFWNDYGHVFISEGGKPVSMHLMDVITNVSNQLSYENSVTMHLQQQLWQELGLRYLQEEKLRDLVIRTIADEQF